MALAIASPEPAAARLVRTGRADPRECLEHVVAIRRRDPGPVIDDTDLHARVPGGRRHDDLASGR